jgi:uncharacterized protein involved in type VI secretion and phage assembly
MQAQAAPRRLFFGKYRGKVKENQDPYRQGRIQVSVPTVLGEGQVNWALPCAPFAGPGVGFFAIPPKEANVWVEFEGGDPNHPIWCGGYWERGQVPAEVPGPSADPAKVVVLRTEAGTITLDASRGEMTVEITNGDGKASIRMEGKKVSINRDALQVDF